MNWGKYLTKDGLKANWKEVIIICGNAYKYTHMDFVG